MGSKNREGVNCPCSPQGEPHSFQCRKWLVKDPCWEDRIVVRDEEMRKALREELQRRDREFTIKGAL